VIKIFIYIVQKSSVTVGLLSTDSIMTDSAYLGCSKNTHKVYGTIILQSYVRVQCLNTAFTYFFLLQLA